MNADTSCNGTPGRNPGSTAPAPSSPATSPPLNGTPTYPVYRSSAPALQADEDFTTPNADSANSVTRERAGVRAPASLRSPCLAHRDRCPGRRDAQVSAGRPTYRAVLGILLGNSSGSTVAGWHRPGQLRDIQ